MKEYKTGKRVCRIPPVPAYDIEGMENWLSDLAENGLFLETDGFFAGIATFEAGEPKKTKYRLEAARKSTSMWSENSGEPDPEQIELGAKYSWDYVAKRGDFYIYRNNDESARELNTDPDVQALALNDVKKRKRQALFSSILLFIGYPLILTKGCIVLTSVTIGTWRMALTLLLIIALIAGGMKGYFHLRKLQKSLSENGTYSSGSDWRKRRAPHILLKIAVAAISLILVFAFLRSWSVSVTNEDRVPIDEYTGTLPFATMADLAGEGSSGYMQTMTGMGTEFNTLSERSDILAPRIIDYNENARVMTSDGDYIDGGLYLDYYELKDENTAKMLAKEIIRLEKLKKGFEYLETPEISADFAAAYEDSLHFPTVLIRKENVVVTAYFYQTSENELSLSRWTKVISDSF